VKGTKLLLEIVAVAVAAIRANALRSALTTLGIVIGVGAVITMVALGEGAQRAVEAQIESIGTTTLSINPLRSRSMGVSTGQSSRMYLSDAEALRDRASEGLLVAPEVSSRQQVTYLRYNSNLEIFGTWPSYFEINNYTLAAGRLFNEGEVQGRRRVAVIGSSVADELQTPPEVLLGSTIQVRGIIFDVVGVLEEKGSPNPWQNPDERVYIPVSTAQYRVFGGRDYLNGISAKVLDPDGMDAAYASIDGVLRREHRLRPGETADFQIRNATDLLNTFAETGQTFTFLLAGIAGVSLLVGGIGIMNIMLVSVTERTREIGVRKALGATRANILFQFLIESLALCLLGGAIGVLFGWGGATLMRQVWNWNTAVSVDSVVLALGFSAGIGLFFGIWPARRAARVGPIDSLRYE
jgi:putative ABC transport system permease protein